MQGLTWGSQDEALQQLLARWTTAMPFALMAHVSAEDYSETIFEVGHPLRPCIMQGRCNRLSLTSPKSCRPAGAMSALWQPFVRPYLWFGSVLTLHLRVSNPTAMGLWAGAPLPDLPAAAGTLDKSGPAGSLVPRWQLHGQLSSTLGMS